jgi:hypothetical protein
VAKQPLSQSRAQGCAPDTVMTVASYALVGIDAVPVTASVDAIVPKVTVSNYVDTVLCRSDLTSADPREKEATLRQEAWERRTRLETLKPFIGTLRVNESRPAELAGSRKRVLRGGGVTLPAKRRQRVSRPCD